MGIQITRAYRGYLVFFSFTGKFIKDKRLLKIHFCNGSVKLNRLYSMYGLTEKKKVPKEASLVNKTLQGHGFDSHHWAFTFFIHLVIRL